MSVRICVIGTRGIPTTYGGVEKHCEQLYTRLVEKGFKVFLFARNYYNPDNITLFKGITIVNIVVINVKGFETFLYSLLSTLKATCSDAKVIHFHAQGPALFAFIPKIFAPKKLVVFTCHGVDWKRDKWGLIARLVIRAGEFVSARFSDTRIMVASHLKDYYLKQYKVNSTTIHNGVSIEPKLLPGKTLEEFKLLKDRYFIFVGRLVPEKAPEILIKAFKNIDTDYKLVIVGGSAGSDEYVQQLKALSIDDKRIVFTGYQYAENLQELYSNACAFVSASKLEGFPITVLEAMSYALPVLLSDIPPHKELFDIESEIGLIFRAGSELECKKIMEKCISLNSQTRKNFAKQAQNTVKIHFSWDAIANKTAELIDDALKNKFDKE